jgi:putative redox protein
MATETVTAEWVNEQVFLLRDHKGFPIVMSQPDGVLGADLLPLSLIGCSIWDVTSILKKQKQTITRLEVQAESEREAEPPWRFLSIRVTYRIWGRDIQPSAVVKAIKLTEEKYCATFATLRPAMEIVSDYEIIAVGEEAIRA